MGVFTKSVRVVCVTMQAGGYMQEELVYNIITMLSQSDQLHGYHTQCLYVALTNDISQVSLLHCDLQCTKFIQHIVILCTTHGKQVYTYSLIILYSSSTNQMWGFPVLWSEDCYSFLPPHSQSSDMQTYTIAVIMHFLWFIHVCVQLQCNYMYVELRVILL